MRCISGIIAFSPWVPLIVASEPTYITPSASPSPDVCLSSPLLTALVPSVTWQCSRRATENATVSATSKAEADEDSSESSGGWSGPYACSGTYCVYSHSTFAAGRGIVIISDGDSANTLANLPIFVELASPTASQSIQSAGINTQNQGVGTSDIPGKGRGLVAKTSVHRGEQIMAYTPALIIGRSFVDELSRAEQLRLLRDAVSRLSTTTRIAFWKQLGQTHQPGDDDILDIVMNNSFNLPLTDSGTFIGNFPEVSMYNHDCRPSVAFHLEGGIIHRTQAVRASRAGEELSISYVDSFRARDVRRGRTKRNWGFECACAQCSLSEAMVNASDHRLWRLYEVKEALVLNKNTKPARGGGRHGKDTAVDVADRVELLLSLYAQERLLESHGSSAYSVAALNYNGLKRSELAVKYALLALESYILEEGGRSDGVKDMVALLDEPQVHWSWGARI